MEEEIGRLRRIADRALLEYRQAKESVRAEEIAESRAKKKLGVALEAQQIFQIVAAAVQHKAHKQLTTVVTKCIQTVFGPDYEFKIKFERKRGKTEGRMCYEQNGIEIDPHDTSGGVMEIAAFALRISCLLLAVPKRRKLMVSDEPFKSVHGETYHERTVEMIEALARDLDFQFILVSGTDWLRPGQIEEIGR